MAVSDYNNLQGGTANPQSQSDSVAGLFGSFVSDYDPPVVYGSKTTTNTAPGAPAQWGTIVKTGPGYIDVRLPSGKVERHTSWAGQPVTTKSQDAFGGAGPLKGGKSVDVINPALPTRRNGNATEIQLSPEGKPTTTTATGPADQIPASQWLANMSKKAGSSNAADRSEFTSLQQRLVAAGYLDPKQMIKGQADDFTMKAMADAARVAGRESQQEGKPVSIDDVLNAASGQNGAIANKKTRQIQLTNPEDIVGKARDASVNLLGRGLDPAMSTKLVAGYNAQEALQQNQQADAEDANTGQGTSATTYNQPNLNQYVADQLRQSDPTAAQGMSMGNYLAEFMALLGSGGRPGANTFGGNNASG